MESDKDAGSDGEDDDDEVCFIVEVTDELVKPVCILLGLDESIVHS